MLPHELESEEYWRHVDWVLQSPSTRASGYSRPMFEVREPAKCWEDGSEVCLCPNYR